MKATLQEANREYRNGNYEKALAIYKSLKEQNSGIGYFLEANIELAVRQVDKIRGLVDSSGHVLLGNVMPQRTTRGKDDQSLIQTSSGPKLRGAFCNSGTNGEISGWLAEERSNSPREILIRIGSVELKATADQYRSDLAKDGIDGGRHAFCVPVPNILRDGSSKTMELIDKATGVRVATAVRTFAKLERPYRCFQEYLQFSMVQPLIEAPFLEPDKRCFAVMEGIADALAKVAEQVEEKPLVSVVMPAFNRAGIAGDAIRSVLAQSYTKFELIFVDDGSEDGTADAASAFEDSRIKVVSHKKNRGHSAARNTGINAADGEIICFLDSDNAWDPRYLCAVVGAFETLTTADVIYSGMLLHRGDSDAPFAVRYGHFNRALLENRNYIDTNVLACRASLIKKIGGFDESLRRFTDYDLALRASEEGTMFSVPMLLCHYFYEKANVTITGAGHYSSDMTLIEERLDERLRSKQAEAHKKGLSKPVSVIIPNWNAHEDIAECIDALVDLDMGPQLEVIVVDNASEQQVISYLEDRQGRGEIRLLKNCRNYGFAEAVNQGIRAARPEADILLLNNDAVVMPGSIQLLQEAGYSLPNAGITVPRQILPRKTKTINVHVPFARDSRPCDVNVSVHHWNVNSVPIFHDGSYLDLNFAPFFAAYIKREVFDAIGLLDAQHGRHYRSDRIFCDMATSIGGYKIYYIAQACVLHKLQRSTDSLKAAADRESEFQAMFINNQWDEDVAKELGYLRRAWDL